MDSLFYVSAVCVSVYPRACSFCQGFRRCYIRRSVFFLDPKNGSFGSFFYQFFRHSFGTPLCLLPPPPCTPHIVPMYTTRASSLRATRALTPPSLNTFRSTAACPSSPNIGITLVVIAQYFVCLLSLSLLDQAPSLPLFHRNLEPRTIAPGIRFLYFSPNTAMIQRKQRSFAVFSFIFGRHRFLFCWFWSYTGSVLDFSPVSAKRTQLSCIKSVFGNQSIIMHTSLLGVKNELSSWCHTISWHLWYICIYNIFTVDLALLS